MCTRHCLKCSGLDKVPNLDAELVPLGIGFDILPAYRASGLRSFTSHHASARALHARGNLVLKLVAGNALDETAILHLVGICQIVAKGAVRGELRSALLFAASPCPWLLALNPQSTFVRHFRHAVGAEERLLNIEVARCIELRGTEDKLHLSGIFKYDFIVI